MTEQHHSGRPLPLRAYIALALTIVFFSGALAGAQGALGCLDFTTVSGTFGHIAGEFTFLGKGGGGARYGFLFALSLVRASCWPSAWWKWRNACRRCTPRKSCSPRS